ncbi:MAG: zf-HC2 domain-containing protein [Steroidobacteraceae bacterium]
MSSTPEISDAHDSAAQLIPWLVNGTLAGDDVDWLRKHLAACPRCREDYEDEERLHRMVRDGGPLVFAGESALQKLMARIEADEFAAPRAAAPEAAEPQAAAIEAAASPAAAAIGGNVPRSAARAEADAVPPVRDRERGRMTRRSASKRRESARSVWRSPAVARWLAAAVVIEAVGLGLGTWIWQTGPAGNAATSLSGSRTVHATVHASAAPYRTLTSPAPRYAAGERVRVVLRSDVTLGQLQKLLRSIDAHIVDGPTEAHVYTLGFAVPIGSAQALDGRIATLRADPDVLFAEPADDPP